MARYRTILFALVGAALLPAGLASPLHAQETDGRWLPFVGCWEALGAENTEDETANGLVCFRLEGDGVTLTNHVGGELVSTEVLVADGRRQQVSVEGCEGAETVRFSEDGRRVFTQTDFTCGTEDTRAGTGVMAFVSATRWIDVRSLEAGDQPFAWFQAYRLVGPDRMVEEGVEDPAEGLGMAVRSARAAAAAALDLDDVIEASRAMDATAVESWLVLRGDEFDPSADDLVALADADVPESVIDAVVAVSHPDRFVARTDAPPQQADAPVRRGYRGWMAYDPFWGNRWAFGYGWAPYAFGYSPFWARPYYGYGGFYGGYYGYGNAGYRPGTIVIDRRSSGGRVYRGRGYSRSYSGSGTAATGGRIARPRGGSGTQPSYSRGGGGSAGRATPSSGSRPTGRKAKRRPSGGR
jgi:hypothetical protein